MNPSPQLSARKRRSIIVAGAAAALLALGCVCTSALPGAQPTATPGSGQATAPGSPATPEPGQPTIEPGQPTEAAQATEPPAPEAITTIPPTASIGNDYHEVKQGQIDTPGQQVTYTFDALAGQEFYFAVLQADSGVAFAEFKLTDDGGTELFNQCLGCGDPGTFVLSKGGQYTVSLTGDATGTGAYQIVIASVRVETFAIALGDPIAQGQPGPGAGGIESPGARDMYTFDAETGQELYFGVIDSGTVPLVRLRVVTPATQDLFASCVGCGNPGVFPLDQSGTYTLIVGSGPGLETGTYSLVFNPVRTDTFNIAVGDAIGDNVPGPGAGDIETPGARDVYTFTANVGQQITVSSTNNDSVPLVGWRLTDPAGTEIYSACLGCGNPEPFTLEAGGTYTLTVGGGTDSATGTYQLDIH